MTDVAPPQQPGWYADAQGAWWWWDGATWSPAPPPPGVSTPAQERGQAVLMWVLYLVVGGWLVALVFYLMSDKKPFVRHHAAEALNLTIVLLPVQLVTFVLFGVGFVQLVSDVDSDPGAVGPALFITAALLSVAVSVANLALGILATVRANQGAWYRLPIRFHPVRGVVGADEDPPFDARP